MKAHAVATIVGAWSSSYSTLGVATSRGVIDGSSSDTTPATVNVMQARASVAAGEPVTARMTPPMPPPVAPAMTLSRANRELAATS